MSKQPKQPYVVREHNRNSHAEKLIAEMWAAAVRAKLEHIEVQGKELQQVGK